MVAKEIYNKIYNYIKDCPEDIYVERHILGRFEVPHIFIPMAQPAEDTWKRYQKSCLMSLKRNKLPNPPSFGRFKHAFDGPRFFEFAEDYWNSVLSLIWTAQRKKIPNDPTHYVYLLKDAYGLFKVGRTNNLQARQQTLNTARAFPLTLTLTLPMLDHFAASQWETYFLNVLHKYRIRGEWLCCDEACFRESIPKTLVGIEKYLQFEKNK